jgi:purine nucleosidase
MEKTGTVAVNHRFTREPPGPAVPPAFLPRPSSGDTLSPMQTIHPRARVLIDNDLGGDPDGLFQLAHHALSPSVEIRGIIGSRSGGFFDADPSADQACRAAEALLEVMGLSDRFPVHRGAETTLPDAQTPAPSAGAEAIVREAQRTDDPRPLYVCCGAGLTSLATALLTEPSAAGKLTLVWIGGPEFGQKAALPGRPRLEYNLGIDIAAAQAVFNYSTVPIWQVPRDAYRQALVSLAELRVRVKPRGATGRYLVEKIEAAGREARRAGLELGETYVLGDSPLVLLTALQSAFDRDAASSAYTERPAPRINDDGSYAPHPAGRPIRVYTSLDTRLMFEDFCAKLASMNPQK